MGSKVTTLRALFYREKLFLDFWEKEREIEWAERDGCSLEHHRESDEAAFFHRH
jgi:hypothetical protein